MPDAISQSNCCAPDCCTEPTTDTPSTTVTDGADANTSASIRQTVRDGYGRVARGESSSCCGGGDSDASQFAAHMGYGAEELSALPEGANLGLSCGNPTALAELQPGDVVLDLGSGAGFDVFIAADRVGATGQVIGVDMTADMIDRARDNATAFVQRTGTDNVEFRLGEIEHLPVADASIDVIISNCVINLSPDKAQVWREIARVLKPGGRVSVSDIALKRPLPDSVRTAVESLVGCVAGAVTVAETEAMVQAAGLADLQLQQRDDNIAAMDAWHDPLYREIESQLPEGAKPVDYITSLATTARKAG